MLSLVFLRVLNFGLPYGCLKVFSAFFQCLSKLCLNDTTVLDDTTSWGKAFQWFIIRCVKNDCLIFVVHLGFDSFILCPLVIDLSISNNLWWVSILPVRYLYTCMMSPLSLLWLRLNRSSVESLSSYGIFLSVGINFVALLCIASRSCSSFIYNGVHAVVPYSNLGRMRVLYSSRRVS